MRWNWLLRSMRQSESSSARKHEHQSKRRRFHRPSLELLEDRITPSHVTYHGGPLINDVVVQPIFYGSAWRTDPNLSLTSDKLTQFLGTLVNSPYMDYLSQYNLNHPRGSVAKTDGIAGPVDRQDYVSPSDNSKTTNGQIQSIVLNEIQNNRVIAPASNNLYFVFLAPGMEMADQPANELGYHADASGNYYAVIAYPGPLSRADGTRTSNISNGSLAPFQSMTTTASHELVEAITNPTVGAAGSASGYLGQPGDSSSNEDPNSLREAWQEAGLFDGGWYDEASVYLRGSLDSATTFAGRIVQPAYYDITADNEGEIGDLSEGNVNAEGTGNYGLFQGYEVQYYFMNSYTPPETFAGLHAPTQTNVSILPPSTALSLAGSVDTDFEITSLTPPNSEGAFSGLIGTFYDGRGSSPHYTATITWGDGNISQGTVTFNSSAGLYEVRGSNDYKVPGGTTVTVNLTVTSSEGASTAESTSVTLQSHPPVFNHPVSTPLTISEGQTLNLNLSARDPDGNPLTYSLSASSPGHVELQNGQYTWKPLSGQAGTYKVTVTVEDQFSTTDATTMSFTVNVLPGTPHINSPPALNVPPLLAFFDQFLGAIETLNSDGTVTEIARFFGFPLLVSTFDSSGHLESVTFFGMDVTGLFESF